MIFTLIILILVAVALVIIAIPIAIIESLIWLIFVIVIRLVTWPFITLSKLFKYD